MISDYTNFAEQRFRPSGYPVRHRRKVPFEPKVKLDMRYRALMNDIMEMDRRLDEMILTAGDYTDLINEARTSNIHWSTKVEGNPLSMKEVRRISTSFFREGDWKEKSNGYIQEILNHLHSLVIADRYEFPWSRDVPLITHSMLMTDTGITGEIGKIRETQSVIIGTDGFEYMIPCPPETIREELDSLMDWLGTSPYDALITATLFFHEFESIHPFTDGNGRTGRALFQILLQELGLRNSKLCRFEEEILGSLETYYDMLGYVDQTMDYGPLIMYIAGSLHRAYVKAVKIFGGKDVLKDMDETSRSLATRSKKEGWFTITDAAGWVKLGGQSVRNKLNELVDMGVLEKEGRTNGTRFRFKDPFASIKDDMKHNGMKGDSGPDRI